VVLVYNDITERIRNEQALADAKARLSGIFDSVMAGIVLIDAETRRVVDINRRAGEMIGAPVDKVLGSECHEYLCAKNHDSCPILDQGLDRVSRECEIVGPENRKIPIYKTVVPVELNGRKFLLASFIDITDRVRAEAAVRQALTDAEDARAKMDGILQSVADPLIVTDPGQRIVLMNRAAEKLLGLCLYQSRGLPLAEVIADARLLKTLQGAGALEERDERVDFSLPAADGGGVWTYQGRTSLLHGPDGRIAGKITIMRNVTREREIEQLKSEFVSTAAHELQTPLAAIIGFSELLLSQKGALPPEVERESLTYIFNKADLLSKIVDDLLDISRIESGRPLPLLVNRCELNALIEQAVRPYRMRSEHHLFELHLPAEPVEVMVDRRKFEQILDNILSNAFKYSPDGGLIRMSVQCDSALIQVSVEDQGIGMSSEQKSRIYDKFYRGDASNTSIGGTGLGMSITKYFVEAHGGRIWVDSELGQGTKVGFEIPIRQDDRPEVFQSGRNLFGV